MELSNLLGSIFRGYCIDFYNDNLEFSRYQFDGYFEITGMYDCKGSCETYLVCENITYAPYFDYGETILITYTSFNYNIIHGDIRYHTNKRYLKSDYRFYEHEEFNCLKRKRTN